MEICDLPHQIQYVTMLVGFTNPTKLIVCMFYANLQKIPTNWDKFQNGHWRNNQTVCQTPCTG